MNSIATKDDFDKAKIYLKSDLRKMKQSLIKWFIVLFTILALLIAGLYIKR